MFSAFLLFTLASLCVARIRVDDQNKRQTTTVYLPNPNDEPNANCNGVPCQTTPYVYNTQGGPVIQRPSICLVFWGTDLPDLTYTMGEVLVDVFENSPFADGWSEYGVLSRPSRHPACKLGITITPTQPNLTPDDIPAELRRQIALDVLPAALVNTHYVVFWPSVTDCTYCGYHTYDADLTYSLINDHSPAGGCYSGCLAPPVQVTTEHQVDWFESEKTTFVHEIMEASTDPFISAWFDPQVPGFQGEIGDLCTSASNPLLFDVVNGNLVQKWWSEQAQACVTYHLDYVAEAVACGTYDPTTLQPIPWTHHPYDCTDQYDHSRCMYCKGWANGYISHVCLPRLGSGCNAAFNTAPRQAFCNLEFECESSVVLTNVLLFASVVLAAFLL